MAFFSRSLSFLGLRPKREHRKEEGDSRSQPSRFRNRITAIDIPSGDAYSAASANPMATSAFGDHLRRERELRGIPLDEVCAATRISMKFLEALESGDWDELPGGVFRRGFIRSVSRFLGLDEESMLAEYALETHDLTQPSPISRGAAPDRRHWLLSVWAIGILLILAAVFIGYIHVKRGRYRRAEHGSLSTGMPPR
jgi:transcriptional regulator with XRE-family HTH domain